MVLFHLREDSLSYAESKNTVEIWPAIDLLGGNCVRLQQGDYNRDTVFYDNPGAMA